MHRLRKGYQPDLSFHKEHHSKVVVLPCFPGEPVCADDKGSNGELFCFIYTTVFKKVKLRLPFTRFERELLTELNIAPAQLHPNSWAFIRHSKFFVHICCYRPQLTSFSSYLRQKTLEIASGSV